MSACGFLCEEFSRYDLCIVYYQTVAFLQIGGDIAEGVIVYRAGGTVENKESAVGPVWSWFLGDKLGRQIIIKVFDVHKE